MPFDPAEFLTVAERVAKDHSEGSLRTAVGRAYFAVAISAWYRMSPYPRQKRKLDHGKILKAAICLGTGAKTQYGTLLRLRAEADYNMTPSSPEYGDWEANWELAKEIGWRLIGKVDKFTR